jgi:hypothetical protein
MPQPSPIFFLAIFTLGSVALLALGDLNRVQRAIRRDEQNRNTRR